MFQDAASPVMEGIINLHHDLMFFITFIFFFVLVVMVRTLHSFRFNLGISSSDSRLLFMVQQLKLFELLYFVDISCSGSSVFRFIIFNR